ncbi:unnamed protein product [Diplocarpon coronariae]
MLVCPPLSIGERSRRDVVLPPTGRQNVTSSAPRARERWGWERRWEWVWRWRWRWRWRR